MFGKKKNKQVEINYDRQFVIQLLSNLNLLDVNNLIAMATIQANKNDREALESIMKTLEPLILKAVREGKTSGQTEWMDVDDFGQIKFPHSLTKHLDSLGYRIGYELNYNSYTYVNGNYVLNTQPVPEKKQFRYNFSLYKPFNDYS